MDKEYLTIKDVAELFNVHTNTVRRWLRRGQLPGRQIGRSWRVSKAAIDAYLAENPKSD